MHKTGGTNQDKQHKWEPYEKSIYYYDKFVKKKKKRIIKI